MMSHSRTILFAMAAAGALLVLAGCGAATAAAGGQADHPAAAQASQRPGGAPAAGQGGGGPIKSGVRQGGGTAQGVGDRKFGAVRVQVVSIQVGSLTAQNSTAGSVVPVTLSSVASLVAGVAARVLHRAGDWVPAGEIVVQLEDAQLKLAMKNAQSALENARINSSIGQDNASQASPKLSLQVQSARSTLAGAQKNYDAQKALFDIGGASGSQLDAARSQLEQAKANLEAAEAALDQNQKSDTQSIAQLKLTVDQGQTQLDIAGLNLQNASIKAPFAGQIAAVNVNPGMYVGLNTTVFILVSREKQVTFSVPPADAPSLPVGTTLSFVARGASVPIRISQASSAPIGGVVPMVASVPISLTLPYGTVGTVSYSLTLAHGALVPIAALETSEDTTYVFTVVDGKAAMHRVTVIGESETTAAVEGLTQGTQVIVNAPPGLLPGSAVQLVAAADPGSAPSGQGATR
jgi:multidrug efflux pump subunit AcrA (membrane-fusion protein)